MKVQWLGHSCFRLEESTGTVIVTDPYHSYVGYTMPEVKADAVTISHNHQDHNKAELVEGNPRILNAQGAYEVKGVHIRSLLSDHDKENGRSRGHNLIF
ncbi:MAG: MBL fold metallo-hydrolase, partial [Clostridia bacterium]